MAQLLSEKLQELQELSTQTQERITNASKELESSITQANATELAKLKQQLQEQNEQNKQALESSNTQNLNAKKSELESANRTQLEMIKQSLNTNFTQTLNERLEAIAREFKASATESLKQELQEPITQSIKNDPTTQTLITNASTHATNTHLQSLDFSAMINYSNFDTAQIATELAKDPELKELARSTYQTQINTYLDRAQTANDILEALHTNAIGFYNQAMKSDELLKDRYEAKLRLLCFKIFGTQELVESILIESARRYEASQRPPNHGGNTINNILVVQ